VAALKVAIERRRPRSGCVHHSDRGSQYASRIYRAMLADHAMVGSMSRRGNPYDNAKAESFMKTLKVEAVYPMAFETFDDVADQLPRFIDDIYNQRRLFPSGCYVSPAQFEQKLPVDGQISCVTLSIVKRAWFQIGVEEGPLSDNMMPVC
jgi:putative transposase